MDTKLNNKRRIIRRFFLLVFIGFLFTLGFFFFIDKGLEGIFTNWFEDHLMAVYDYYYTANGEPIYIWRPNWAMVKIYVLFLLIILVCIGSVLILILSKFLSTADVKDRMEDLGEMIHQYIFSDREASDIFPKIYNDIAYQMSEVKEKMRQHERLLKDEAARKNDLITYLAHDLKTPLTSVIGYLSLLSEAPDMPLAQRAKYTNIAFEKAQRLESLINEFFDITRFNLQQVRLDIAPLDLTFMLVQMIDEFYPLASKHGNTIILDAPDDLTINGDSNKLARVFNNILKNAIAYSDPDSEIHVKAQQQNDKTVLTFSNSGPTIPPEKLNLLFEKFFRLDESRSSQTGGAGLGLAIAHEIVTLHNGTISATSQNHQTAFIVVLPSNLSLNITTLDEYMDSSI
ncbi:MAG: HAMP domain-containing sensor histidine kinase [Peptococcaceae bacterium]|nr:HAMP domain-containing sensor histidine kinase [Peptococcaceae bacterium]